MKSIAHKRSREVEAWLRKEVAEQKVRYRKIVKEQDDLEPTRNKWIAEFLHQVPVPPTPGA